jgi:protein SCO1/2
MYSKFISILLILASGFLSGCDTQEPVKFESKDVSKVNYAQGFKLSDFNGVERSLEDFKGKVVVIFFGYTQCPDICPTSLGELVRVKQLLGPDADKLQGIFVTLDPQRDEPQMLKAYLGSFDSSFVALVPSKEQLQSVTKEYKIIYKKIPGQTPTSYTMDHSAGSYVYDTNAQLRLFSRYGSGAEVLAHDIKALLAPAK